MGPGNKNITLVFERYRRARVEFAQAVAGLAKKENAKCLQDAGALELLQPLLSDAFPTARQAATIAVARLCEHEESIARAVYDMGMIKILLNHFNEFNAHYKRAALYVFRSIAKHNAELATGLICEGALDYIVNSLEDPSTEVKENAAWALGYIARHSKELATSVVDAGAVQFLVLAFQNPELCLKQIVASALLDLAQHRPEALVEAGAIRHLVKSLDLPDPKLKGNVLATLSAVASASLEMAETVAAACGMRNALLYLDHEAEHVRRNAACLIRDIVKHSEELAELVVVSGGATKLVQRLTDCCNSVKVPAAIALGFIAGQSGELALKIIRAKAIPDLAEILKDTNATDVELCATAWTLGQIAKHSPDHCEAVAVSDVLPQLLQLFLSPESSPDLRGRACSALKLALQHCLHTTSLEALLITAPPHILKYVLAQYSKILPEDAHVRRMFVSTGMLRRIQELVAEPGTKIFEYIMVINSCFPEEIVRYFSPGYSETLLEKIDEYIPKIPELFTDPGPPSECMSEITVNNHD